MESFSNNMLKSRLFTHDDILSKKTYGSDHFKVLYICTYVIMIIDNEVVKTANRDPVI